MRSVFISYCHKDKKYLRELKTSLAPVSGQYALDVWDDSRIGVGEPWHDSIVTALEKADVGVLLVSPDFLASRFVTEVELPKLLRARAAGMTICVVHVRASVVAHVEALAALQAVNSPARPL